MRQHKVLCMVPTWDVEDGRSMQPCLLMLPVGNVTSLVLAVLMLESNRMLWCCRPEELPEMVLGAARIYRTDLMEPRPFPASLMRTSSDMPDTPTRAA